jgi:hypothetical protein
MTTNEVLNVSLRQGTPLGKAKMRSNRPINQPIKEYLKNGSSKIYSANHNRGSGLPASPYICVVVGDGLLQRKIVGPPLSQDAPEIA